jgi:hypothetical protein
VPKHKVLAGMPAQRGTDALEVSIGDLAVVYRPEPPQPPRPPRRRPWLLAGAAVVVLIAGVAVAIPRLVGDGDDKLQAVTPAAPVPPKGLEITVAVSQTTIHYGESVTVTYSWSDADGKLLNTNHVGSSAAHYVRNTECKAGGAQDPQPSGDQGTWVYTADALNFGPPPEQARTVEVGLEVHTGGCAPEEDKTVTEAVTVLPPA